MLSGRGLQRAAQDARRAAAAREVHLRHHRAAQAARHDPLALPAPQLPPHPHRDDDRPAPRDLAAEKAQVSDRSLALVARQSEGGMRDALSLLDQILSACGPNPTDEAVAEALGAVDRTHVHAPRQVAARADPERCARGASTRSASAASTCERLAEELALYLRHVFVAKVTREAPEELAESEQEGGARAGESGRRGAARAALRPRARVGLGHPRGGAAQARARGGAAQGHPPRAGCGGRRAREQAGVALHPHPERRDLGRAPGSDVSSSDCSAPAPLSSVGQPPSQQPAATGRRRRWSSTARPKAARPASACRTSARPTRRTA